MFVWIIHGTIAGLYTRILLPMKESGEIRNAFLGGKNLILLELHCLFARLSVMRFTPLRSAHTHLIYHICVRAH